MKYGSRKARIERNGSRMSAALSSEAPARQPFGMEVLVHSDDAIDMSRAANGLPLLANHDSSSLPIGRVENVRREEDKLRGDLAFSAVTEEARNAHALADEGTLRDVSVRYEIHETVQDGENVRVTRWTPVEASLVSVPADASVGIGRSLTEAPMPDETPTNTEATPVAASDPNTNTAIIDAVRERSSAGFAAGADAENVRLNAIRDLTSTLARSLPDLASDLDALAAHCNGERTITAERHQALALELIGGAGFPLAVAQRGDESAGELSIAPRAPSSGVSREGPPMPRYAQHTAPGDTHRAMVQPGRDAKENAARGMELSILERAGTKLTDEEARGNRYRGWSMLDLARDCLELHGHSVRGMSSEQIARAAIMMGVGQRAISPGTANYDTTDFPAVTENVITKRINDAYAAAPVTWSTWCSTTQVPDFKQFTVPRLSQISDLPIVAENAAYTDLTQTDAKEAATLVKRGGLMSFSWEAIVNDDQRMFSRTAASMGEAAARTIDTNVYALLTLNQGVGVAGPVMGDTVQLFAAAHSNFLTNALDLAGIVDTRTAMARQTDDNSIALGIDLRYVIVPEELRDAADNLAGSEYIPWTEASPGAQRVNTVRSTFTVVPTIRLTDATDWYAAAANGGTIEVAFLTGNQTPAVFRDDGWNTDAMHWKIRHPSIAYAVDWRGLSWNEVGP